MIQFIVIAKGSERVAEVGARFTLDAMPGKQMSIDAELRAGHIDHKEARRRRSALARESQFFGSMDGAMKFVKGDAIAGIIILCVNIAGGLIIGIVQRDMDAGKAAHTYTILTIGEGLIAQIPALIISTAAGVIVTRVASDDEEGHLGKDIGTQVLAQPKALAIGAALLLLFAIVPGFPALPFLVLAAVMGFVAYRLMRRDPGTTGHTDGVPTSAGVTAPDRKKAGDAIALPAPLVIPVGIDLSPALTALIAAPENGAPDRFTSEIVPALRQRLFAETGLPLPAVRVRKNAPNVPDGGYTIRLQEIPMAAGTLRTGFVLAAVSPDKLAALGLDGEGEKAALPDGTPGVWMQRELAASVRLAGIACLGPEEILAAHLFEVIRRHGHELIGIQEVQGLLDALEQTHPALVREVVPKLVPPVLLTDVLRRLAEEGVSLRNLREILQALADWGQNLRDPVELTERVRSALRRQISHRHAPNGRLTAYLLDPMIEDTVREGIQRTDQGNFLALAPELSRDIVNAVAKQIGNAAARGGPVLLTTADIRRYVRKLVDAEMPHLAVLSYQELSPELQIQPLGRIGVGG